MRDNHKKKDELKDKLNTAMMKVADEELRKETDFKWADRDRTQQRENGTGVNVLEQLWIWNHLHSCMLLYKTRNQSCAWPLLTEYQQVYWAAGRPGQSHAVVPHLATTVLFWLYFPSAQRDKRQGHQHHQVPEGPAGAAAAQDHQTSSQAEGTGRICHSTLPTLPKRMPGFQIHVHPVTIWSSR